MDLPHEQRFHFHDGTSIGSLAELSNKLATISYVEFYKHVNPDKNDFANWIRHVLKEERVAAELEKVSSIVETIEIINDHLHPRALNVPRTDLQSAVEQQVFGDQYPGVEEVPTTAPKESAQPGEVADFTIIEESLEGEPVAQTSAAIPPMPPKAQPAAKPEEHKTLATPDHMRMIVRDFIWGFFFGLLIGAVIGKMLP